MEAVTLGLAAVAVVVVWTRSLERRERTRHDWRMELARARVEAVKGADVVELAKRVQRLELKGLKP